jgi:hypothetical protein
MRASSAVKESDMIRMQIVERPGVKLFSVLKRAMRSGDLRTFSLERRGTRVIHVRSPGFMNWTATEGIIACEIRTPRDEGKEWQLLSNVIGRLSDRFPDLVESINIQLAPRAVEPAKKKRKKRKR